MHQASNHTRHIPGRLNVIADKLSRLGQTIQTEWSLLQQVFQKICNRWHQPQEIHAWLYKNIRNQKDWSNVSLYPAASFLSKNRLAKHGPSSVAPVVIPALAPSLYRSCVEDRTLCPVRALRYYLDRTKDIRPGQELVFVSFKTNFF